jgi:hypothetical protein
MLLCYRDEDYVKALEELDDEAIFEYEQELDNLINNLSRFIDFANNERLSFSRENIPVQQHTDVTIIPMTSDNIAEISRKYGKTGDFDIRKLLSWPETAPQAWLRYTDNLDIAAILGFDIYATKLDFEEGTLRLWRGNYLGAPGGELEFFDRKGKIIIGADLKKNLTITNVQMQVFSANGKLIAEDNELTGWANAYNPFVLSQKYLTYLVGTITFYDQEKAEKFAVELKNSVGVRGQGESYYWNAHQTIIVDQRGSQVIIKWGYAKVIG